MDIGGLIINRKEANLAIIQKLKEFILAHPDQRFCQALRNIGAFDTVAAISPKGVKGNLGPVKVYFSNEFYTESVDTFKKVKKRLDG